MTTKTEFGNRYSGLLRQPLKTLREMQESADQTGYYKGYPQGAITEAITEKTAHKPRQRRALSKKPREKTPSLHTRSIDSMMGDIGRNRWS